jgi:hypothetical protein
MGVLQPKVAQALGSEPLRAGLAPLHYYAKHPDRVSQLVFYGTSATATSEERQKDRDVQLAVIRASWEIGSKVRAERLMPFGGSREDIERLRGGFGHRQAAR